jgi:hypothetical protein
MQERLIRAIYGIQFVVAWIAALLVWNYVGGPTHLEAVPWFWKGLLSGAIATAAVRITAAGTLRQAWKWIGLLVLFAVACGLLSYYAHINEPQDEGDDTEQTVPTSAKTAI